MAEQPIHVGLVGSKFMGRTHSNAYLKVDKFFDVPRAPVMHCIAARNEAETRDFAERWGWRQWTTDWREILKDGAVELVDVVTPNHLHAEQSIAALEAGKHVACEKPLAGTLDDARRMKEAAEKARGQTFVWFNYRRCPAVALAHQLVREGRLGRIFHVRAAYLQDMGGPDTPLVWRFQADKAGSGAHGDLNAHIVDMARFITGEEMTEISGAIEHTFIEERELPEGGGKGKSTVDDAVLFLSRFTGGALGSFEATRLSIGDKNHNRIEVHGEKGALRFNFERMNELEWFDATLPEKLQGWSTINVTNGNAHPYVDAWWPPAHLIGYEHGFINEAADILNQLGGKQPVVPIPDFADAYQTQRVLQAALESARNRCPVPLEQIS